LGSADFFYRALRRNLRGVFGGRKMKLRTVIIIVVILALGAAGALFYLNTPYYGYKNAFEKTLKVGSANFATVVTANVDGDLISASGDFKMTFDGRDSIFINVMQIEGQTITQFSDAAYVYSDDGKSKMKFKIGDDPNQRVDKEEVKFDVQKFTSEFARLLDASKIRDLQILQQAEENIIDKITKTTENGKTVYNIEISEQLVDNVVDSVTAGAEDVSYTLNEFTYRTTADEYVEKLEYLVDADVTIPGKYTESGADETKNFRLELSMTAVNPGSPVEIILPDTSSF
jgi:hypothetical protein